MPVQVLGYWGDQMGDFPSADEASSAPAEDWGETWFMLPNPMYGSWAE
jgi:predicted secreted acid phosphatase